MVDENQFRGTYHELNQLRCVFEKGMNARRCSCAYSEQFLLGGRQGWRCTDETAQQRCVDFLKLLRQEAKFTLGMSQVEGQLPHNKELRIQAGGLQGLYELLSQESADEKSADETAMLDIKKILSDAEAEFSEISQIPYHQLLPAIAAFVGRRKRS